MKREEAISIFMSADWGWLNEEEKEAFRMAIEALQAETIPLSVADKIGEERERLQEKVAELQEKNADRPHGEWIESKVPYELYVCSNCGGACWSYDYERTIVKSNFCPNCGAKMTPYKGGDDE